MPKISLRYQKLSDARRYFEILDNPHFTFFHRPKSINEEIAFLKKTAKTQLSFAIIYGDELIGAVGIKLDKNGGRRHVGELGYFVDERYWDKGIATKAVRLAEKRSPKRIRRFEILAATENRSSQRVAIKSGYRKEGLLKKKLNVRGKFYDAYLFAKIR